MIVDFKKTAEKIGIQDIDVIKMLIGEFFSVCQADIDSLEKVTANSDFDAIRSHAHSIKGAAKNLWLEEVGSAAEVLEISGRNKTDDGIKDQYSVLKAVYDQARAEYAQLNK